VLLANVQEDNNGSHGEDGKGYHNADDNRSIFVGQHFVLSRGRHGWNVNASTASVVSFHTNSAVDVRSTPNLNVVRIGVSASGTVIVEDRSGKIVNPGSAACEKTLRLPATKPNCL